MGASESSCKPCNPGNPATDTVKFEGTLLQQPLASESPKELSENPDSPKELPEEEQRRREEDERLEKERLEEEEERQNRMEKERVVADERRRREQEEEEEERKRKEREDAQRVEQERRQAAEQAAKAKVEEAKRAEKAEKDAAKAKVDAWLKARGFKNLKDPKKAAFCGTAAFALHTAIEASDTETVRAMLLCDADPNLKNSSGKTAREVAERCGNTEVLEAFKKSK